MNKNKYVIYTSLTGGYDELPQYEALDDRFDYICFSNDYPEGSKVGQWTICQIPLKDGNNIELSRYAKLLPHRVLQQYEVSIWLDSNLIIRDTFLYEQLIKKIGEGYKWYGIKHPILDCIYDDARKCLLTAKARYKDVKPQIYFLKTEGYPHHFGLFENNFIVRRHNDHIIKKIDENWWQLFSTYSKRDQLSLFYLFWKHGFSPKLIFPNGESTHNSRFLKFIPHKQLSIKKKIKNKLIEYQNRLMLKILD